MPTLLLLNGPPHVGKSTLARRWAEDRPLALRLDVDEVRALLGQWESDAHQAGLRARALAVTMTRVHLSAGHDVVVPQFLTRLPVALPFVEELAAVAASAGAAFREAVLCDGGLDERLAAYVAARPSAVLVARVAGDVEGTYAALVEATAPEAAT